MVAASLCKLNHRNLKHDDVLDELRGLQQGLLATSFFDVDPEQEIWEVPVDVRNTVRMMSREIKRLRAHQDTWRNFKANERNIDWREIQQRWPDRSLAKTDLARAQVVAAACKRRLASYLKE
jgi:hypothetical protein